MKKLSFLFNFSKKSNTKNSQAYSPADSKIFPTSKKIFNFNPQEKGLEFFNKFLIEVIGEKEFNECNKRQAILDSFEALPKVSSETIRFMERTNKKILDSKNFLLTKAKETREKIKFTYTGFDISKTPLCKELIQGSKNIIENDILDLLTKVIFSLKSIPFLI